MAKAPRLTIEEWATRLRSVFGPEDKASPEILRVVDAERGKGWEIVDQYRHITLLMHSFQSFFIRTLELATDLVRRNGWPVQQQYMIALAMFTVLFRRFRACEILYEAGYPFDAYALMRDIKDRVFMVCAVANHRLTFDGMFGVKENMPADGDLGEITRDNRQQVSNRIEQEFIGRNAPLSDLERNLLKRWSGLFHLEVHNGSLSFSQEVVAILKERKPPSVGPSNEASAYRIYDVRVCELGWMLLKILPYLQPTVQAFGAEWLTQRRVLDESFRYLVKAYGESGNAVGAAFIKMVEKKSDLTMSSAIATRSSKTRSHRTFLEYHVATRHLKRHAPCARSLDLPRHPGACGIEWLQSLYDAAGGV